MAREVSLTLFPTRRITMNRTIACAGAVALALCSFRTASAVVIISTFDSSVDGWTVSGGNESFATPGGNPGGYLRSVDNSPTFMTANAPAPFLGNLTSFDGGTIGFDSKLFSGTGAIQTRFGEISITNGSITGTADFAPANLPDWTTFSSAFTAAVFGLSQSDFTTLLSSVTAITLILDSTVGQGEVVGLDNFFLRNDLGNPNSVPEPSGLALLSTGLSAAAGIYFLRRKKVQTA